jgi:hypothetical protein
MKKRPIAVTGLGLLMIAAGMGGVAMGFVRARALWPLDEGLIWIVGFGVAALVCGIFMLRGQGWARWLTLVWVGCHIVISFFRDSREVLVHTVIFALVAMLLFRSDVREYFRGARASVARPE